MGYELLLVNTARDFSGYASAFRDSIGQYAIASYLRERDFKAFVFSGDMSRTKSVIEKELQAENTKIVGFYAAADNIRVVGHMIKWLKGTHPDCITIVGGPQAAGLDYDFFYDTQNDYAIVGEGEIPIYLLLSVLIDNCGCLDDVPSLVRMDDIEKKLIVNYCDNAVVSDLDSIGFPRVEDSLTGSLRQTEVVGIITGRGCPFNCAFCYEGANAKNVRLRSIKNVMEEIDYISEHNDKLNFISIYDDTFTMQRERVLEFCDEMKKRKITWFCEGHVTFVLNQTDVLKKMIESGLACIQFGIESGSDNVLNAYNKHTNFEMIVRAIEICKKLGIHSITGNFIIGGALETKETIEESKKLARELIHKAKGIIELYTVYFAPYPNTRMVREPQNFDIEILEETMDISLNTMRTPVVSTKELSRDDIYDLKHEFDEFIAKEYQIAANESTKEDIIQGLYHNGKRTTVNPTWDRLYLSKLHISVFLDHLKDKEQKFDKNGYIIRTFEDIKIEKNRLISDVGVFEGVEKNILENATGVYTANELSQKFNVSINDIEKVFYNLNNRCLVFMSEF